MTHDRQREFRVRRIPDELYKQFKIVSVLKGLTVNELFLDAMAEIVEKEKIPDLREKWHVLGTDIFSSFQRAAELKQRPCLGVGRDKQSAWAIWVGTART